MASVFRPSYSKIDPKTGKRIKRQLQKWYVEFEDASGKLVRVPGYRDKEATRELARSLERRAAQQREGIIDPFEEHRARPLSEHLEDFRRYLAARGNTPGHVATTIKRVGAVLAGCRFERMTDFSPAQLVEWLAGLRNGTVQVRSGSGVALKPDALKTAKTYAEIADAFNVRESTIYYWRRQGAPIVPKAENDLAAIAEWKAAADRERNFGASIQTANYYLTATKSFARWLVADRRMPDNPFAGLKAEKVTYRREVRTLSTEDFGKLIKATRKAAPFRGLSGKARAILYQTAGYTGLRASELASLSPSSFDFASDPCTVTVAAEDSKHREEDVLPLRADLAEKLAEWARGRPGDAPLWPGKWHKSESARMLDRDLKAAKLPKEDEAGRVFHFHALRHMFISNLARSGVHPKAAQALARHSTITLTMDRYSHLALEDQSEALSALPPLPGEEE